MDKLHEFKEFIEDELEKIRKKGDLTPAELDSSYKAIDILKDIEEIKSKEMDGGYSGRMPYFHMPYSYENHYEDYSGNYWGNPYSYGARKRDSMGRYAKRGYSRDGYYRVDGVYSNDDAKDRVMEHLRTAMEHTDNAQDRETIRECIEELEMK